MPIAGEDRSDKTYTSMLDEIPYHIPLEALVAKECAQRPQSEENSDRPHDRACRRDQVQLIIPKRAKTDVDAGRKQ
jgi:hypothetical protein